MISQKAGDWNCRSCQYLNFKRRDSCQQCGTPKIGGDYASFGTSGSSTGFTGSDVRPGDWYCTNWNCGTHNFANRTNCYKCYASKDESGGSFDDNGGQSKGGYGFASSRSGWKSGDWICTRFGCNEHNFASRTDCFRCHAPRDYSN